MQRITHMTEIDKLRGTYNVEDYSISTRNENTKFIGDIKWIIE